MSCQSYAETLKRFSTALISDALDTFGINGGLEGILPLSNHYNISGPLYIVTCEPVIEGQLAPAGDYIDDVEEHSVILISNQGSESCTVWGDILSLVAKRKNIAGTIIDGACRDVNAILELDYPVFSKSRYMKSGKNRTAIKSVQKKIKISSQDIYPGDYIRGDASGVVVIPQSKLDAIIKVCCQLEDVESQIIKMVTNGMSLKEARIKYKYNDFSYKNMSD